MPTRRLVVLAATLALVASGAASAAEETPRDSHAEAIDVRLVEVDVVATGVDGRPIVDLPREAFRLFEDGAPVEISHFAPPAGPAETAEPKRGGRPGSRRDATPTAMREPLLVALFVDDLALGSGTRAPLLAGILNELALRLAPGDRVAIARFDGAAQELLEPSADRRALKAAFERLEPLSPARILGDQQLRATLEAIRADARDGPCLHGEQLARGYADSARRDTEASAAALTAYVGSLAGLPGSKSLIYVSDGPAFVPGLEALEHAVELCDGTALAQGVPGAKDTATDLQEGEGGRFDPRKVKLAFAEYSTQEIWRRVVGHANAVGVTLYSVQSGGASAFGSADPQLAQVGSPLLASSLEQNRGVVLPLLADGTGGTALGRGGDVARLVDGLIDDSARSYTLAFSPAERTRTGLRSLKVEVDRPGVRLRFRQSYLLRRPQEEVAERLYAFLLRGEGDNPLALAFGALPAADAAAPKLRLEIPLERIALVPRPEGGQQGSLIAYVALEDARGRVSGTRQRSFAIAVPAGGPSAGERYRFDLELPPSRERREAAVAVVDLYSGEVAFAKAELD